MYVDQEREGTAKSTGATDVATLVPPRRGRPFSSAYGDPKSYGFQVMLDKKIHSLMGAIEKRDPSLYRPYLWELE